MKKSIILIILTALFFSSCEHKKNILISGKTIKVGVLAPLSGQRKKLGNQSLFGLKASKQMKKYLQNGDEIIFEIIDTKSDTKKAKEAFKQLIKSDVKIIISFMSSSEMVVMKDIFNTTKIPIISTLATNDNIISEDGYITQVCIDNKTQVLVASHYIKDEKFIDNVGIVYDNSRIYSSTLAMEFKKYYTLLGGKIDFLIDVSEAMGMSEFREINKKDIGMLFNTTGSMLSTKVLKIINQQDYDFEILGTDGLYSGILELSQEDIALFNGVYVVEHYVNDEDKSKNLKELEELLYKNKIKDSSYAFLAYDGYQLLIYALENCSIYSTECINAILHNSDIINGVSGNFNMLDARAQRDVYVDKIDDGILKKEVVIN